MERPVFLDAYLAPLTGELERPDVTDIFINRPGEYWVETVSGKIERVESPQLSLNALERLSRQIASATGQGINRSLPLLSAGLPNGVRVQIVAPSASRTGTAMAFRKSAVGRLTLEELDKVGAFRTVDDGNEAAQRSKDLVRLAEARQWRSLLVLAVRQRRNILISGGTSSGKTTFLNALLREIPDEERLVLIEDTPELAPEQPNVVSLLASRGRQGESDIDAEDLVTASLRLRPDRILLGEIRGREALAFLRAVNTGHPGSMTTIHADTPERAVEQLALLVLQSGARLGRSDVIDYVKSVVDVYVQLDRVSGRRLVSSVKLSERESITFR